MRRPDKGLGLTASRLLQSWATGDRRKLRMPPKRKLGLDCRNPKAMKPSRRFAPSSAASLMPGLRPMARSRRWPACRRRARLVGRVLQRLDPVAKIPWHRVVNAKGEVSYSLSRNGGDVLQRRLLEKEGIRFDDRNRLDLAAMPLARLKLASQEGSRQYLRSAQVSGSGCIDSIDQRIRLRPAALAASARG